MWHMQLPQGYHPPIPFDVLHHIYWYSNLLYMLSHVIPPVISLDVQKMQIIMATNIAKGTGACKSTWMSDH